MNPKVFISHASEDKDRFVLEFATKLRENGVDAWLDKWEMLPGDSLVDKIFESIKEADSFIIVLSNNSINSSWVKEELNASFIKRVNRDSKIIPIVLDNCEVPECLHSTIWEKINNLSDYSENLQTILKSIHGISNKPSLGEKPGYVNLTINNIQGLNKIDSIIFAEACKKSLQKEDGYIGISEISSKLKESDISDEEVQDTLEILNSRGYIEAMQSLFGGLQNFKITLYGFESFAIENIGNYDEIINKISLKILNDSLMDTSSIQDATHFPRMLINHILKTLERKGYIQLVEPLAAGLETYAIIEISAEFKRLFR